jgi:deoxyribonuclease-1
MYRLFVLLVTTLVSYTVNAAPPVSFSQAKRLAVGVYADKAESFYCGCDIEWQGKKGIPDLASCGYEVRKQQTRANRIEWEHIVPASNFGRARQCWQEGGRKNCVKNDPVFAVMEADMHNLTPTIGEVNGDRSNYNFSQFSLPQPLYGLCDFKVDFKTRQAEPRDDVKGQVARVYFYMYDRYGLNMSKSQQQLLMQWDKDYPVTEWEREKDHRVSSIMGHNNPFVTGEQRWQLDHQNTPQGLADVKELLSSNEIIVVRGNKNSKVYHLPEGCPSYNQVSSKNIVNFNSEALAKAAGYRKAGNCKG